MPLTPFQAGIARLLAANRSPDSHLAGGAALNFSPNSIRYSNDLDYFQDSAERVATAFEADETLLRKRGYSLTIEMRLPGYIRSLVGKESELTKVEWSHDSAWRFMPTIRDPEFGYRLHPVDLSINKVLTLVGRNEPRDFLDVLTIHREVLPLGALCWAASGKDPGFTPHSLLGLLKRRGTHRPEDFARLRLTKKLDLTEMKTDWLEALASAEAFISERPPSEAGCLYHSPSTKGFYAPSRADVPGTDYAPHFGQLGGVLPFFPVG